MAAITEEGLGRVLAQMIQQTQAGVLAQVQALLQQQQQARAQAPTQTAAGVGQAAAMANVHKRYSQVGKLSGADDWREWHYQWIVATKAFAPAVVEVLEKLQVEDMDEVATDTVDQVLDPAYAQLVADNKAGVFSILTLWTKGDANAIVRSVDDQNGFVAWKRLYDRYNPRTPASLTSAWREIIRPKKIRDLREAVKAVDLWEAKISLLKKEHNDGPSEGLKASLLIEMLPEPAQMTIAQGMQGRKIDYEALKSRVRMMANVHAEMATPKPMEVGELGENDDGAAQGDGVWEEVGAVGKGKGRGGPAFGACWTCGGPHFASECPHGDKGPKGGKGGVKSAGKGEFAGKAKGKGKLRAPMYGSCWVCGGAHFQADCPSAFGGKGSGKGKGKSKSLREIDEEPEEQHEVESVTECWNIFELEVAEKRKRRGARPGWWCRNGAAPTTVSNRFAELAEGNSIDDDTGEEEMEESVGQNCTLDMDGGDAEWIQWVTDGRGEVMGKGEIIVDSGASESVCPWGWAEQFPVQAVAPWKRRSFLNASGGRMGHYGERRVRCGVEGMSAPIGMCFQVSDARNPLASVARITENGNVVQFGPRAEDNYIFNPDTEEKVMLRKKGNKFILDVNFLAARSHFSGQA